MKKKKVVKGIVLFIIYVLIFAFLIHYISANTDTIDRIKGASRFNVIMGLMCSFACMILTGLMDVTFAKVFGVKIGYGEAVGLTHVASLINLILPLQMGSMAKAIYLKKSFRLAYTKYVSILSGTAVINLMITLAQIILCMIAVSVRMGAGVMYIGIFSLVFVVLVLCFAVAIKKQDFIIDVLPFKRISTPIMEGFFGLLGNRRAVILVTGNLILTSIFGGIRFFYIFKMLGYGGNILDGFLYYGLYNASTIVPILPGNIGISELLVGGMNEIIKSSFNAGVTAVLINRLYYYAIAIIGSLFAVFPLWIKYSKSK